MRKHWPQMSRGNISHIAYHNLKTHFSLNLRATSTDFSIGNSPTRRHPPFWQHLTQDRVHRARPEDPLPFCLARLMEESMASLVPCVQKKKGAPMSFCHGVTTESNKNSVAFCSPAKSLTFSGLMENPLVGKKLKSFHPRKM